MASAFSGGSRGPDLRFRRNSTASIDRLQGGSEAWYGAQSGGKEIAHPASAVCQTKEDSGEAVDAVKRLQLQWKNIAPSSAIRRSSCGMSFARSAM